MLNIEYWDISAHLSVFYTPLKVCNLLFLTLCLIFTQDIPVVY